MRALKHLLNLQLLALRRIAQSPGGLS